MSEKRYSENTYVLKWIIIGIIGFLSLAIVFIFLLFLISKSYSPDGGLLAEDSLSPHSDSPAKVGRFEGSYLISTEELPHITVVRIKFNVGSLILEPGETGVIAWDCDGVSRFNGVEPSPTSLDLDFGGALSECSVYLPQIATEVRGSYGSIAVKGIDKPLVLELNSGVVSFQPVDESKYDYDIQIEQGYSDETFEQQGIEGATMVKIRLENGRVLLD